MILHLVVLLIRLPPRDNTLPPRTENAPILVRRYMPPPPPIQRREVAVRRNERRMPVPDPTPDDPEPVLEPPVEVEPVYTTADLELLIGTPEPPPTTTTHVAGLGDVTHPVRLEDSYVPPEYPEEARVARIEGKVILEVIIRADGDVGEIRVLLADVRDAGFERAAIAAVRQWRYEPARYRGRAVDVFFTVVVDFDLM